MDRKSIKHVPKILMYFYGFNMSHELFITKVKSLSRFIKVNKLRKKFLSK